VIAVFDNLDKNWMDYLTIHDGSFLESDFMPM